MAHFVVDFAKIKQASGGSIKKFAERNELPRRLVSYVNGRRSFVDGSVGQGVAEKLLALGVGQWVNDEPKQKESVA